jgi:hypothetical protein
MGCATALFVPNEEMASQAAQEWPGTTLADLQLGRRCYLENCAACHNLHLPSEFPAERWAIILEKMQPKAHINDQKKELILHYLEIASTEGVTK